MGSYRVVINGAISPLIWLITIVTQLILPLISTHEPPSNRGLRLRVSNWNKVLVMRLFSRFLGCFKAYDMRTVRTRAGFRACRDFVTS